MFPELICRWFSKSADCLHFCCKLHYNVKRNKQSSISQKQDKHTKKNQQPWINLNKLKCIVDSTLDDSGIFEMWLWSPVAEYINSNRKCDYVINQAHRVEIQKIFLFKHHWNNLQNFSNGTQRNIIQMNINFCVTHLNVCALCACIF